ncbi:MAG: S24/S26 family peptidase [Lachnospiraceae bacterium]|nr:S24/S26 family peptidase [Lachnospiraceae bacterium]
MICKVVDNDKYLPVLRELVNEGRQVRLNVRGNSMFPFMKDVRDSVIIEKPSKELERGDIVFFQRRNGDFVLHRIQKADKKRRQYYIVGDAQKNIEGPVDEEQIFGIITKVCRDGKWIDSKSFVWWFYKRIWLLLRPVRLKLILCLTKLKSKFRRREKKEN